MMKRILSSESKEIWKIETGSGPICRFLERRESFRYPTESAYRIWERSTLFWNIFIPFKSKKKQTPYRGMLPPELKNIPRSKG